MMTQSGQIAAALTGTPTADRPVNHGPGGTLVVSGIEPDKLLQTWRSARALLPTTGRWPVLITDDWSPVPMHDSQPPPDSELAGLDLAARTTDPWLRRRRWMHEPVDWETGAFVASGLHGVDLTTEGSWLPEPPPTRLELERRLYERVLSEAALTARVLDQTRYTVQVDYWFTPDSVLLMLLPTDKPWLAPTWVDLFEVSETELAAALWQ
jgi:hypothetical protein